MDWGVEGEYFIKFPIVLLFSSPVMIHLAYVLAIQVVEKATSDTNYAHSV